MVLPAINSKLYWQHNLPIYFSLKNDHIFPKIRSKYLWIDLGIFFFEWQLRPTERMVHRILHLAVIALQPIFKSVQNAQRRHASVASFL